MVVSITQLDSRFPANHQIGKNRGKTIMEILAEICDKYPQIGELVAFGSRLKKTADEYSDWDVICVAEKVVDDDTLFESLSNTYGFSLGDKYRIDLFVANNGAIISLLGGMIDDRRIDRWQTIWERPAGEAVRMNVEKQLVSTEDRACFYCSHLSTCEKSGKVCEKFNVC